MAAQRALSASELSYRRLFEAAQDGILILDAETGRITDANPFLIALLGFTLPEMVGKTVGELSPFKDIVSNQEMLERLQSVGYVRYDDLPLETRDGRRVAVEFVSNVYQAGDKRVIQCNIRDITARKQAGQQMGLLNACIANLTDIVLITDAETNIEPGPRIVFVNPAFERLTGYTSAEALGRNPRFLQGKETDRGVMAEIGRALAEQKPIRRQIVNYRKDGTKYWVDMDIVPIFDPSGKCSHFAAIARDVTGEKANEAQLRWKTAFFEAQVNSAPDAIIVVDSAGKLILQNRQMLALWNPPPEIFAEHDHRRRLEWVAGQVMDPQRFSERAAYLYAHPAEVSRDELELSNGKCLDRYTAPVLGPDGTYFGRIWTYRDITEAKKREARFRRLVESDVQGVTFWNTKGEITDGNNAFLAMVGYTREDLNAGRLNWMALTPPEFAPRDRRRLEEVAATGSCTPYEKEYLRQDGTRVPVLVGAAGFADNREEGVAFCIDLRERKKLELQFLRAQRMESIGTLAGGIAHDLNNILAPIVMSIGVLRSIVRDPRAKVLLEAIESSAQHGTDVVRQVLTFARGLEGQRIEVRPRELLHDLSNIIKNTFPKDVSLQVAVPTDAWSIMGDPTQVHQVLLNLCVNARDAMPHGGNLALSVENTVLNEHYDAMHVRAKAGHYVCISVTDSGTGMPPAIVEKIFEPFFTTKKVKHGTGLGLSTAMAIVKSHAGAINVYSEPGKGTKFKVFLPAMDLTSQSSQAQAEEAEFPRGNGETVLLVDDEASIIIVTSETLQAFGYRVLTAADGAEAVAAYAQHQRDVALVLTDMAMPIMGGAATIRALTKINPAVKIIAASGLSVGAGETEPPETGIKRFLIKPYTAQALLRALRATLDEA